MPSVASLQALHKAIAEFAVTDLTLVIEPAALAAARRSLDSAGLLLLGEVHGVRENPLIIRALMRELGLTSLALEWFDDLASTVRAFLGSGTLADHEALWPGDGRITAGHLAMLAERAAAGPLDLVMFDGIVDAGWSWTRRNEAMAERILAAAGPGARTLAVAGNAHTPTRHTSLGVPLGARLARQRPGVRDIRISYAAGSFYNIEPRQFRPSTSPPPQARLHEHDGDLILDLPSASEAVVPQRPGSWPPARPHPPRAAR
jgi:erythromycin esterase-like protein